MLQRQGRRYVDDEETVQSARSKAEGFDRFFDFCLLDIVRRGTIGVGR